MSKLTLSLPFLLFPLIASIPTSPEPSTDPPWLPTAIKDIAYYLRSHKFNEYDRRYEPKPETAVRDYHRHFPRPPLRSLHWEVHKYCEPAFIECVAYLEKTIRKTGAKRTDDTATVLIEQKWSPSANAQQMGIVDAECKKLHAIDDILANPFEGPLERFQWRTTASYFMCLYTMQSEAALVHFNEPCDNFARCLAPGYGPHNFDDRADDRVPFACALYSFCPDPCCPQQHVSQLEDCWESEDNPCFEENLSGSRQCALDRPKNNDIKDLILNRWNVSCSCPQAGFVWNSLYGMCVDVDECAAGTHKCRSEEVCVNMPGAFKCVCQWGHVYDAATKKCKASRALDAISVQQKDEEDQEKEEESFWRKLLRFFAQKKEVKKKW